MSSSVNVGESIFTKDYNLTRKTETKADKRESVRSKLALYYVYGFFAVIGISFLIGYSCDFAVGDYKEILLAISGVLSGPLGFIIGFYFKDGEVSESNNKSE